MSEDQTIQGNTEKKKISNKLKTKIEEIATKIKGVKPYEFSQEINNIITDITISEIIEIAKWQGIVEKNPNGGYFFSTKSLKSNIELRQYFIDTYKDIIIERRNKIKELIKINIKIMILESKVKNKKLKESLNNNEINNIEKTKKQLQEKESDTLEKKLKNLSEMSNVIERESLNISGAIKVGNDEINEVRTLNSDLLTQITKINENKRKNKKYINKEQLEIANLDSEINAKIREYYATHNSDLINQQQKINAKKQRITAEATRKAFEELTKYTENLGKAQVDGLNSLTTAFNSSTEALNKGLSELNKGFGNGLSGINNSMMGLSNQYLGLQATIAKNTYSSLKQTLELEDNKLAQQNAAQRLAIEQQYKTQTGSAYEVAATAIALSKTDPARAQELYARAEKIEQDATQQKQFQTEQLEQQIQQQLVVGRQLREQVEYLKNQSDILSERAEDQKRKLKEYLKKQKRDKGEVDEEEEDDEEEDDEEEDDEEEDDEEEEEEDDNPQTPIVTPADNPQPPKAFNFGFKSDPGSKGYGFPGYGLNRI